MFLFRRRRVAPAPAVAPVAPPPRVHDEVFRLKNFTIVLTASYAGVFVLQLILLFLFKFLNRPSIENFELQYANFCDISFSNFLQSPSTFLKKIVEICIMRVEP